MAEWLSAHSGWKASQLECGLLFTEFQAAFPAKKEQPIGELFSAWTRTHKNQVPQAIDVSKPWSICVLHDDNLLGDGGAVDGEIIRWRSNKPLQEESPQLIGLVFLTILRRARILVAKGNFRYLYFVGTSHVPPRIHIGGMAFVPMETKRLMNHSARYQISQAQCVWCSMIEKELRSELIIYRNKTFVLIIPYAAPHPLEIWLLPLRHRSSFLMMSQAELHEMAKAFTQMFSILNLPPRVPYTWTLTSAPPDASHVTDTSFHWHLRLRFDVIGIQADLRGGELHFKTGLPATDESSTLVNLLYPEDLAHRAKAGR